MTITPPPPPDKFRLLKHIIDNFIFNYYILTRKECPELNGPLSGAHNLKSSARAVIP